jgi:menaquinone-specific isochorismate synthase
LYDLGGIRVVTIHKHRLLELITIALKKSKQLSKPILVSSVRRIDNLDPLTLLQAGKKFFQGKRFFWTDPENKLFYVGLGTAYHTEIYQSDSRFFQIEEQWKRLLEDRLTDQVEPYGTGPVMFGGFSFDPNKEKTDLWIHFPHAKFVLPMFLYTTTEQGNWLTTNVVCQPEDNEGQIIERIEQLERDILHDVSRQSITPQSVKFETQEVSPEQWMNSINDIKKAIINGEVEKVVLAREMKIMFEKEIDPVHVLYRLLQQQPSSYIFAFESGDQCFLGASPERLVKKEVDDLFTACVAGSIKRGNNFEEDHKLGQILLSDKKNLIEHEVVVHMIKESMTELCEKLDVSKQPQLYKMRDIQHLYTPVKGKVKKGISIFKVIEKLHPTPALGGFPKEKAIEMIRETEILDRGWYAAPIGWVDAQGNGEFAVAIRSGLLAGNRCSIFAGCGIVADSDPMSEYRETEIKFKPMLSAFGGIPHGNN